MKKIITFGVLALLVLVGIQVFSVYKVNDELDQNKLNEKLQSVIISSSESIKMLLGDNKDFAGLLGELTPQNIKENFKITAVNKNSGILSTNAKIELIFGGLPLALNSDISHILGFVSAKGDILPSDENAKNLLAHFFKNEKPFSFVYDGKTTLKMDTFELKDKKTNIMFEPLVLIIDPKNKGANIDFSTLGANIADKKLDAQLKNLNFKLDLSDLSDDYKSYKSNSQIKVDEIAFKAPFVGDLKLESFSINDDASAKDGIASADLIISANKLNFNSNKSQMDFNDIKIDINAQNIDVSAAQSEQFDKVFGANSALILNELSFVFDGSKLSAKLGAKLNENYTKNDYKNIANFLNINGEFSSQRAISVMFGSLLSSLASMEQNLINQGYLLKENEGYKTSFEGNLKELTFNGKTKLDLSKLTKF